MLTKPPIHCRTVSTIWITMGTTTKGKEKVENLTWIFCKSHMGGVKRINHFVENSINMINISQKDKKVWIKTWKNCTTQSYVAASITNLLFIVGCFICQWNHNPNGEHTHTQTTLCIEFLRNKKNIFVTLSL